MVADDLTGAAEVAAWFGPGTPVLLWPTGAAGLTGTGTVVVDADTRALPQPEAAARMGALLARLDTTTSLAVKIDSLLRGPLGAVVGALVNPGRVVVVAPALPHLDRTTLGGVVRLAGVPLADTDAWAIEASAPPSSVAAALAPLDCVCLGLDRVRDDGLAADLDGLRGRVVVCDAETPHDLNRIAEATRRVRPATVVGAAAICQAFFDGPPPEPAPRAFSSRPCLTIVGTAVPAAVEQVALLVRQTGATPFSPAAGELLTASERQLDSWRREVDEALAHGDAVLSFGDRPADRPGPAGAAALAALVARISPVAAGTVDMIVTGGQTARSVLDALRVGRLTIRTEVSPGAIVSELPSGALLGTRPGSFGGLDSLLELRRAMEPANP